MKKRIRLHQVRVGMFVEDLESSQAALQADGSFLVASDRDIDRVMRSHALSVIINTGKGRDIDLDITTSHRFDPLAFEAYLSSKFSVEQIQQARKTVDETRPHVHNVLSQALMHGTLDVDTASLAVEKVMSEAMTNAGALIGVAKLKNKDEGTFLHSLAVSALMITFGRSLSLGEDQIRLLGLGGMVHDLGKTALPIDLLRKPGKLTADELAVIRTHPDRGYDLLNAVADMPQSVLDICLYHHEKFDGSGYPHKLAASSIPLVARIAAICDAYDALTSLRPYKRAWTQAEAIDTMLRSEGHFDPDLLKAFISKMVINGTIH